MTEYRVRLAREMRNWPEAGRLQRVRVVWDRRRADAVTERITVGWVSDPTWTGRKPGGHSPTTSIGQRIGLRGP